MALIKMTPIQHLTGALRKRDWRGLALPLALLGIWYAITALSLVNTRLIVPPGTVFDVAVKSISGGPFYAGLQTSLLRDLSGFGAGSVAGILLGGLLGISRLAERFIGPTFHTLKQISLFAWLPLISSWLGATEGAKILFIGLSAFYPVALNTFEGVRSVTRSQIEVARVYRFNRRQLITRLILPAAAPQIATGLQLALLYAWLATIGAEYLLGTSGQGIGSFVIRGKGSFDVALILFGMLVIGLIGAALNQIATWLEARALHWRGRRS
jgi:sulfonate transport system permease protein